MAPLFVPCPPVRVVDFLQQRTEGNGRSSGKQTFFPPLISLLPTSQPFPTRPTPLRMECYNKIACFWV
ncbi:Hypothetical protein, putative [Bodo saltans]|uniref:Uncharacterized protein n=1 Tax=Bodo saltans TaxID=75058 RepID=A0A0S4JKC8_BODSA|nr:Hypothetical protein, putative [Bodo saltans]|eukprot:CUG91999.1 Hypothetical protein, putative [Bodo saltans]